MPLTSQPVCHYIWKVGLFTMGFLMFGLLSLDTLAQLIAQLIPNVGLTAGKATVTMIIADQAPW